MFKYFKTTFLVSVLFSSVSQIYAQKTPINFRFYNANNGFHFDKVKQIEQDKLGFLWMATNEGLVKYDGNTFSTFENRKDAKLLNGKILHMLLTKRGNLWFGTNNGVVFYNQQNGKFSEVILGKKIDNYVNSIAEDAFGKIWIASEDGLRVLQDTTLNPQNIRLNDFQHLFVLCRNGKDVWATTSNSVYHYDATTFSIIDSTLYSEQKNRFDNIQTAVTIDNQDNVWIGRYHGEIYKLNTKTKKTDFFDMKKITGNPSALINSFFVQDQNTFWVVVDEAGIWRFDYQTNSFLPYITPGNTQVLPSFKTTTMFVDQEQNMWLGMTKNGLAVTSPQMNVFRKVELANVSNNHIVSAICQDSRGQFWVGTDGGGLMLFDKKLNYIRSFKEEAGKPKSLGNDAVLSIFEDSKKRLWIGTFRGGLSLLDRNTYTFKHYKHQPNNPNSLPRNDIRKILEDKNGHLWLAVHGKGVTRFDPEKEEFKNFMDLSSPWTYDAIIGKDGTVWTSSVRGISRKKKTDSDFQHFYATLETNDKLVNDFSCLFEDKANKLWIGSVHGLYQFSEKENKIVHFKSIPLLNKSAIKAIREDDTGNLFISTNQGLFRYDLKRQHVKHFGSVNGLISEDFILNVAFKGMDSTLYFGTSKGICWLKPSEIQVFGNLRTPVITDIKLFGNSILPWSDKPLMNNQAIFSDVIELNHDQNNLNFEFSCPTFAEGSVGMQFQYQLFGLEASWQNTDQSRNAYYPTLPSGKYTFKVRAISNESDQIFSQEQTLVIIIKPPFWETWWFRITFIILLLAIIWMYYRYKTKRLKLEKRALEILIKERTFEISQQNERLEEQRAELELANVSKDKLFSIIGHDLRSPFSAVLALGEMLQKSNPSSMTSNEKEITRHIVKASQNAYQLLENILHWARTQTGRISFRPSKVDVQMLVQSVVDSVSFQAKEKRIGVQSIIEQNIVAVVDKDMLETILRNLLNNAIKFSQVEGSILVEVKSNALGFDLHIKDNGVGMTEEQKNRILNHGRGKSTYGTRGEAGTGLGLLVCKEFLEFHMATWDIYSDKGVGTEFVLHIPCEYEEADIHPASDKLQNIEHQEHNGGVANGDLALLLDKRELDLVKGKKILVVDDLEEIRKSIVYQLNDIFEILEAANGNEAFRLAKEHMPDLIISDVVMPEMNGLELSTKLKQDLSTSHIPIVLLTSQKEELEVVAGLQTGVDEYLLKPFVPNILFLKITKLLINRENLKKKFSLDDSVLLESIAENSQDQQLMNKVFKLIDDNLSEEEFGVEALSEAIGMHRSNFSKKISSITGSSPQDLIKTRRMKHAAKLLLASGKNVSEVAYETGFSDPKYFSRVFKSYFGVLPSEYVDQ
jgi:ligand-binding sensor domain-containing protein/signal transduction histidine kinase/CheY-like chemotaxis protein/AraC-like DNA-binding protein